MQGNRLPDGVRKIACTPRLNIETVSFQGVMQLFPHHFHDHYVIGCIQAGSRRMFSRGREYRLGAGDVVLFAPGDVHACETLDGGGFTYHCCNVPPAVMRAAWGDGTMPCFALSTAHDPLLADTVAGLAASFSEGLCPDGGENALARCLGAVAGKYCLGGTEGEGNALHEAVEGVCAWLREHAREPVSLAQLGALAGMNKFVLLRAFVRIKGITPYRYLAALRLANAREMLARGLEPAFAAADAGFSDQSHFARHFKRTMGLTPGQYRRTRRAHGAGAV